MDYPGSLHNHTGYSNLRLRDSIIMPEELIDYAIELGHEVVAITEHECISNAVKVEKYYEKIKKTHPDFKVILGNEIYLCRNGLKAQNFDKTSDKYWHFILLAKDAIGHQQIREISTRAWMRSYMTGRTRRVPTYYSDLEEIIGQNKGHIIGSTACLGGVLPTQILKWKELPTDELYSKICHWCQNMEMLFGKGNFFLELQPSASEEQTFVNRELITLSEKLDIPYIITTDSHYLKNEDRYVHKAYLNSEDGEREVDAFYATTYMMDTEELESRLALTKEELEKAYSNIRKIKDICEDYSLRKPLKIPELAWKIPEYVSTADKDFYIKKIPYLFEFIASDYEGDKILANVIIQAIKKEITYQNQETYDAVNECLQMTWDSSIVNKTHWSAYYLNLQKIIDTVWEAGSLVGPGRGSGVGFILLNMMGITQINPLRETTKTFAWRLTYRFKGLLSMVTYL